ncbi:hypothetical protein ACQCSX_22360 (plasmid) [Pseudarthrobacter sp. P1]|uniref:hypothetical protein n=1 Tax=Pseudarthrobacter sp. P1 TaxID=3418418 RepID=UPI003CF6D3D7
MVDHPGGLDDPRVALALGVVAFLGPEQRRLFLRPADEHHALRRSEVLQVPVHHIVLALAPGEVTHGIWAAAAKRCTAAENRSVILAIGAVEATGNPNCRCT